MEFKLGWITVIANDSLETELLQSNVDFSKENLLSMFETLNETELFEMYYVLLITDLVSENAKKNFEDSRTYIKWLLEGKGGSGFLEFCGYYLYITSKKTPTTLFINGVGSSLHPKLLEFLGLWFCKICGICQKQLVLSTYRKELLNGINFNSQFNILYHTKGNQFNKILWRECLKQFIGGGYYMKMGEFWENGLFETAIEKNPEINLYFPHRSAKSFRFWLEEGDSMILYKHDEMEDPTNLNNILSFLYPNEKFCEEQSDYPPADPELLKLLTSLFPVFHSVRMKKFMESVEL